jgi:hypothetical protein
MQDKKFKYFVLLANMRTGSNLFEQNINLYDDFSCHGELFNPHFIGYPNAPATLDFSLTEREKKPIKLIEKLIARQSQSLPGFRLFADHDDRVLEHCLADPGCAKIVLTRNPLDSFVSHGIARATDQWKLTDLRKRKSARVDFDFVKFKAYLERIQGFLARIHTRLQETGQTAFFLSYEDLNRVRVFNGLVKHLGGHQQLKQLEETIKRQNPGDLEDKVSNYRAMVQQIKEIDFFGTGLRSYHEPERNPGISRIVGGVKVPLLYLPIGRAGHPAILEWMLAQERNNHADKGVLTDEINQRKLAEWLKRFSRRQVFTLLCHPVERAYDAFYDNIFLTGESGFPWIRKDLQSHYNLNLPVAEMTRDPNRVVLENSGYGVQAHAEAFQGFLKFLKGNLLGQTRARTDHGWSTQTSVLDGYAKAVKPDMIIRPEDLSKALCHMENVLELDPVAKPAPQTRARCFSLAEIYNGRIESAVREIYARDYTGFGFGRWNK